MESLQISTKLFFPASRKDIESKLYYLNLENYIQKTQPMKFMNKNSIFNRSHVLYFINLTAVKSIFTPWSTLLLSHPQYDETSSEKYIFQTNTIFP